jgi:hypothetical protein
MPHSFCDELIFIGLIFHCTPNLEVLHLPTPSVSINHTVEHHDDTKIIDWSGGFYYTLKIPRHIGEWSQYCWLYPIMLDPHELRDNDWAPLYRRATGLRRMIHEITALTPRAKTLATLASVTSTGIEQRYLRTVRANPCVVTTTS